MATLLGLCDDVYTLTKRPDLVAETKLAVRQATLKMHHLDYFPKDLHETGIQFSSADNIQSLAYKSIVPRWRALRYLRKYDGAPSIFFTVLDPTETLDRYAVNREDICYLAGEQIEIRSSTALQYALLGCYVHPDVTEAGYSSWIADEFPFAIISEAAAFILNSIGWDEQAQRMKQMAAEQVSLLRQQISPEGY